MNISEKSVVFAKHSILFSLFTICRILNIQRNNYERLPRDDSKQFILFITRNYRLLLLAHRSESWRFSMNEKMVAIYMYYFDDSYGGSW